MIGISDDPYASYCFDEACMAFGAGVQEAMDQAKGKTEAHRKGNAENILRRYLGLPRKFRDINELRGVRREDRPEPNFKME